MVYNAQHEALGQAWAEGFTKQTGIKVTIRNGGDTEFANQLVQEGSNSPADIFLTENSPAMSLVDSKGLFASVDAETLSQVPEAFKAADGKWIGVAARTTVFAYDKAKLKEADLPKSLLDLADPKWKGRWAASPAGRHPGGVLVPSSPCPPNATRSARFQAVYLKMLTIA